MAKKHKIDYFQSFVKISDHAVNYAERLIGFLEEHYDEDKKFGEVPSHDTLVCLKELHEIEEASDDVTHEIISNLVNEFVTPIEREDILSLAGGLDNVVDELDDVLQRMYMCHVTFVTEEVIEMAHVVLESTRALQETCVRFTYFKKSHHIHDYIVKVNDCEDEGDKTYIRSVHRIFGKAKEGEFENMLDAVGLASILGGLERCCDACEDVADSIVTVIAKNS